MRRAIIIVGAVVVCLLAAAECAHQALSAQPQRPIQWKIGTVYDIDLYVLQTKNRCFYITHHHNSTTLYVLTPGSEGCQ